MLLSPVGSPRKTLASLSWIPDANLELRLPIELIIYIAELAAQSSKKSSLSLCLVSSWIRQVTLPHLYMTLVLHDKVPISLVPSPFYASSFSTRSRFASESSPVEYMRHLWVDVSREIWPYTFSGCTQLTMLAMHLDCHEALCQTDDFYASDPPPCRSFTVLGQSHTIRWANLTNSPQGLSFLNGLTHLRLLNMCLSPYIPLINMPNLTHLCLPFFDFRTNDGSGSEFSGLDPILEFTNLKLIVLTLNPRYWRFEAMSLKRWAILAMEKDDRLHVVASIRVDATKDWEDAKKDWESEARGGESIWDKAIAVRKKFMSRGQV
ncbi:hypothetical protein BD410DRAFT_779337 [Rickenella mellea]|uniref:F-box domain-containing protein n=1 Tax=Rickenella mellea TaxID=50990 RepID=A0A4R5XDD4_9AGAM|nr:hypothetical protein BD410DRAFT_779337 [Rickenella mellea]